MLVLDTQNGPTIWLNNATTFGGENTELSSKGAWGKGGGEIITSVQSNLLCIYFGLKYRIGLHNEDNNNTDGLVYDHYL